MTDRMPSRLATHTSHARDGAVVVTVTGEIDLSNADTLHRILLSATTGPGVQLLVCDMSEVNFLACSGLAVILAVQSTLADRDAEFRLVSRKRAVLRPLTVTGLLAVVEVRPDLAAAIQR